MVGLIAAFAGIGGLGVLFYSLDPGRASLRQLWGLGQANYHEFREKLDARHMPGGASEQILLGGSDVPPRVEFRGLQGRFSSPASVELFGDGVIRYTTDGSIPSWRNTRYVRPVAVKKSTVLRARVLASEYLPGEVSTFHFIATKPDPQLPVVSIAADPVDLWSKYSGIYANATERGRKWERQAHVGFFAADAVQPLNIEAELRIHGGFSRQADKKSFRMRFSGSEVSALDANHILRSGFGEETTVVIRGDPVNPDYRMHDVVGTAFADQIGLLVSRHKPVEVYLNGEYWGVYDLREYVRAPFLQSAFDGGRFEMFTHDSERADHWLSPIEDEGDVWEETLHAVRELDLSDPAGHAAVAQIFDLDNTIDYWAHNIIVGNVDWPHNNVHVYRRVDGDDRRWKWISWDLDHSFFDAGHNTLAWSLRDRVRHDLRWNHERGARDSEQLLASTELMRLLLKAPEFRRRFVARVQVLLDVHYRESKMNEYLESMAYPLLGAYARDAVRWGWEMADLEAELESMKRFAVDRPARVRAHLGERFGLDGDVVEVPVAASPGKAVTVEGVRLPDGTSTLTLLAGTELEVSVEGQEDVLLIADEGMRIGS